MSATTDPKDIREAPRSTQGPIEDREWKRYQRYLRKLMQQRAISRNKQPAPFVKKCDKLQNQENSDQAL
jgi:hypothetical protein